MNLDEKEYYKKFDNTLIVKKNYYFFIGINLLFIFGIIFKLITSFSQLDHLLINDVDKYYSSKFNKPELIYLNDNYDLFKNNNPINKILTNKELNLYWSLCLDVCEHPEIHLISKLNNIKLNQYICNKYINDISFNKSKIKWLITTNGCEISNKQELVNNYNKFIYNIKLKLIKLEFILIISIMILLTLINLQLKKR